MPVLCLLLIGACGVFDDADAYLEAHAAARAGDYGEAAERFGAVAAGGGPLSGYAAVLAAQHLEDAGKTDAAIARLRTLAGEEANTPWLRMARAELGRILARHNRFDEAVVPLKTALASDWTWELDWLRPYHWDLAAAQVAHPPALLEGFDRYRSYMESAWLWRDRQDAASRLSLAPPFEHRLDAAEILMRYGEYASVGRMLPLLKANAAARPPDSAEAGRAGVIEGRYLVATKQTEAGLAVLARTAGTAPPAVAAEAAAWHARSLLNAEHTRDRGREELARLTEALAGTEALGDVLYWWAGELREDEAASEAVRVYRSLADSCPAHHRADNSLRWAGRLLAERGRAAEARATFRRLGDTYPDSRYAPEAWYRAGVLALEAGDEAQGLELLRNGAASRLGDYYTHRALSVLSERGRAEVPADSLGVAPRAELLHARPIGVSPPDPPADWLDAPWLKRLRFFAEHGLMEAEWEALAATDDPALRDRLPALLRVIGEAGLGGSAMEVAEGAELGEQERGYSVARLYVEYPRAYWPQMTAMARATGVDPYLLLSIARQESLFRPRAVSHAGATGVMQLMPATARYLARIEPAVTDDDFNHLTHPARSIRMGAYYMMRMIERSEGNLVFALGSYNGGPGNMAKWRRAYPASDLDAFIDAVPFRETRGYIRKVLGNYAAYRSLYPAWSADSER